MSEVTPVTLKTYFETGDFPTQAQFENLIDSLNTKQGNATTGYGILTLKSITASKTFAGGATETISISIPSGVKVIGAQLRVDTLIVCGGGGVSWTATYSGGVFGASVLGASGQALAKNTKVNALHDAFNNFEVTDATTNIVITPNAGTLTSGAISAVVYYYELTSMTSV